MNEKKCYVLHALMINISQMVKKYWNECNENGDNLKCGNIEMIHRKIESKQFDSSLYYDFEKDYELIVKPSPGIISTFSSSVIIIYYINSPKDEVDTNCPISILTYKK